VKLLTVKVDFPHKKEGSTWDLGKFNLVKSLDLTVFRGHQHSPLVWEKSG